MFVFQSYATKEEKEDAKPDETKFGMKIRKKPGQRKVEGEALPLAEGQIAATLSATEKAFRENGLSEFISTLTPGAQNAIYAASFAWGYENAAKYVKNAMKLEEVKNASGTEARSKAVVESVQAQSSGEHEKSVESSRFVWGYYNEGLKETQAQAAVSDAISERSKAGSKEKEKEKVPQEKMQMPLSAAEAVETGIISASHEPALLYCAGAHQAVERMQEAEASRAKREEFVKLVSAQETAAHKETAEKTAHKETEREYDLAAKLAIERREELVLEYARAEEKIKESLRLLGELSNDDKEMAAKVGRLLPDELARHLLSREREFSKRQVLRKQLLKWLAFCRKERKSLLSMPVSRLIKLVFLSSLFR